MHIPTLALLGTTYLYTLTTCLPYTSLSTPTLPIPTNIPNFARTIITPSNGPLLPTAAMLTPRKTNQKPNGKDAGPAYRPGLGKRRKLSAAKAKAKADKETAKQEAHDEVDPAQEVGLGRRGLGMGMRRREWMEGL